MLESLKRELQCAKMELNNAKDETFDIQESLNLALTQQHEVEDSFATLQSTKNSEIKNLQRGNLEIIFEDDNSWEEIENK